MNQGVVSPSVGVKFGNVPKKRGKSIREWWPYYAMMAPALIAQYVSLIKNSSLAIAIGYQELMAVINTAITQTGLALEGIALAVAVFIVFSRKSVWWRP